MKGAFVSLFFPSSFSVVLKLSIQNVKTDPVRKQLTFSYSDADSLMLCDKFLDFAKSMLWAESLGDGRAWVVYVLEPHSRSFLDCEHPGVWPAAALQDKHLSTTATTWPCSLSLLPKYLVDSRLDAWHTVYRKQRQIRDSSCLLGNQTLKRYLKKCKPMPFFPIMFLFWYEIFSKSAS